MNSEFATSFVLGAAQSGLREFNERLLLTILRQLGPLAGTKLAAHAQLSAQTVSVILRKLESENLLIRGAPQRGKVGKPQIPMALNAAGALSIGLKVGRRSADVALMDFTGCVRDRRTLHYPFPRPDEIFDFLETAITQMTGHLPAPLADRICGIGIAIPFELWKWTDVLGASAQDMLAWRDLDPSKRVAQFSDLPVSVINDATAACHAENALGNPAGLANYAYFFMGAFIGGGIVLDRAVYSGHFKNAGALGSLQISDTRGAPRQLLDSASLNVLGDAIRKAGGDPSDLRRNMDDWSAHAPLVDAWCATAAKDIARASLSACAVIDFEAIVIDGAIPTDLRSQLVERVGHEIAKLDGRGLVVPKILPGSIGADARVIGAAHVPLQARYFLHSNATLAGSDDAQT
ncbi:ROK family transcriptional regulator [Maribius pontilimi]|uniref:ROK family transcriptional regulator n=1 Tax=Palleronia pontilimi TaxID=1964209 RepID=A0A934MCW3_9RHOB|nr:ROK family transcriptional regulator [Palleronia pontilimi]MBJ3763233.1 ROK family transcriptional regulator [Palleronia pontilimi]